MADAGVWIAISLLQAAVPASSPETTIPYGPQTIPAAPAAAAAYGPRPYLSAPPPPVTPVSEAPGWRGHAASYLIVGGRFASAEEVADGCARLNNYWCVPQTWGDPWVGSIGANGRHAAFSDPRWSGRAAAFDLRSRHSLGQASARALAAAYAPPCPQETSAAAPYTVLADPIGELSATAAPAAPAPPLPAACPSLVPEAIAAGTGRGPDEDLGLFDAAGDPTPALRMVLRNLAAAALRGPAPSEAMLDLAVDSVSWASIAQDAAGFAVWRASSPARAAGVARFESFLAQRGVAGVLPTYQMLRTGSDWRGCGGPFTVAPDSVWPNVVETLRLIRDRIKPDFPDVEAMSGYRDAWQNQCMGGADNSAHRQFLALDLVPNAPIERFPLMRKLCVAYNAEGETRNMGLGFYRGVRFHVDTWKHRTWANENGQPLNVCNEEPPVAGPAAPIPYGQMQAERVEASQ